MPSSSTKGGHGCWAESRQGWVEGRAVSRGLGSSRQRRGHTAQDVNSTLDLSVLKKVHQKGFPFLFAIANGWKQPKCPLTDG